MPGTFSKHFPIAFANKTCADFLHPGLTCTQALNGALIDASIGSLKFYFPVCAVPFAMKFRKWNEIETWKEFLDNLWRCLLLGFILNFFSFTGICISFNLLKKFFLPTLIWSAASFGALSCFLMPAHLLKVEGQGLYNMYVEFLIRRSRSNWIIFLRESTTAATLLFSVLHTCVMYGFLRKSSKNFWFSSFKIKDEDCDENHDKCKCIHGNRTCSEYLKTELKKAAKFAFGLSCVKAIVPRIPMLIKSPSKLPKVLVKKFDYGLMMFLFSINGIFKYLFCQLNRTTKNSIAQNCIASAMLSGISYVFYPRYMVFTMAITNAIESLYNCYQRKLSDAKRELPAIMKFINKIPIVYLMFVLSFGVDIQLRIMYPSLTNKFIHKFLTAATNGRADRVAKRFIETFMGFQ